MPIRDKDTPLPLLSKKCNDVTLAFSGEIYGLCNGLLLCPCGDIRKAEPEVRK